MIIDLNTSIDLLKMIVNVRCYIHVRWSCSSFSLFSSCKCTSKLQTLQSWWLSSLYSGWHFCRNLQRDGQTRQANDRTSWIIKILQKVRFLWQPYHQHGVPVSRNIFGAKLSPNDGVIDHPSSFDAPYIIHRPPHLLPRVLVTQDISYTTYQTPHLSKRGCKIK